MSSKITPRSLRSQTHLIAMDSPELCQSPLWRLQAPVWNSHLVKKACLISFFDAVFVPPAVGLTRHE